MRAGASVPPLAGRRILAIRSGALGDTLLCVPALAALRSAAGPGGSLELVGSPPACELARGERLASRVHAADRGLFRAFHGGDAVAEEELLEFLRPFDLVVAWSRLPRLRKLLQALGVEGVERDPMPPEGVHATDRLMESLAPLGVPPWASAPELEIPPVARAEARTFLETEGLRRGRFVAIHPGSGSPRKNWPAERFAAVAALAEGDGLRVLWVEGPADAEAVARVGVRSNAPVARGLELQALAAVLGDAAAFIGNDSGVSHLAAAMGVPTSAVFGPTSPARWAPRGRSVDVVDWDRSPSSVWGSARTRIAAS